MSQTVAAPSAPARTRSDSETRLAGMLVSFEEPGPLMGAAARMKEAGYTRWDVHTPYPIHGLDTAMGVRPTILPWIVFVAGLTGALSGIFLQYWTNATDARNFTFLPTNLQGYDYLISGKPFYSFPANIPVIFELTVLFSALAAVFGMLALNGLPTFHRSLFRSRAFQRVTDDHFFVSVDASDPIFDESTTGGLLAELGGSDVMRVEEPVVQPGMPRWLMAAGVIFACVTLIPLVVIAKARVSKSTEPRIHIWQDMDNQPRYKGQMQNAAFADERAMRPTVVGTVARGDLDALGTDRHRLEGLVDDQWATVFPESLRVTSAFMERGRRQFGIFCAPCHGLDGRGNGAVPARNPDGGREGWAGWVQPTSLHDQSVRDRAVGHLFNSITNGIRTMPPYRDQIEPDDRWAIVAYIRALQKASQADWNEVPAAARQELERRSGKRGND